METLDEYLARQICVECGGHADHRQTDAKPPYKNGTVCREHIDPRADGVRALND